MSIIIMLKIWRERETSLSGIARSRTRPALESSIKARALPTLLASLLVPLGLTANTIPPVQPDGHSETQAEFSGTWRGQIETLLVDNFQAGTSRTRYFLHTAEETLELQGAEDTSLRSGQLVEVRGRVSGRRLAVSHLTAAVSTTATGACTAIGEQKAAVILVSFPSKALLSSVTPELVRPSFFGTGRTLETFLRESSFGQTWISGDVLGPYVLDADYFDQPLAVRDAALRAAAPSADLTHYNRIFIVAPQGQTGMDSGGMALLGCGQIPSPQGNLDASSIWLGAESMLSQNEIVDIASHELGHGFGLEHARFADYGGEPLGPAGQAAAPWDQIHEYGDSYSNMGRQSGQWAAPQKAFLGWLQAGTNIQTATSDGSFNLSPYELAGTGQVLRVRRDPLGDAWLWLEYRQPQGTFDATLPAAAFSGALAHYADPALTATVAGVDPAAYTNLVNFHPAATFPGDPVLHAGQTWSDPYGSLRLTVNSATTDGLNVSVSYAPAPVCPGSLGASQSYTSAGGSGQIPVAAAAGCAWSATASVPWISLVSAVSGSGNGTLSFTVRENPNVSPRWGKITVGEAFVIVTQAGASGWMTLSPQSASLSARGGTGEISVATSAPDFAWSFQSNVPWITDVECSCYQSVGPATLRYIVAANSGPQRIGTITAGGLVFTVTQQAGAAGPGSLTWNLLAPHDAPSARINQAMARSSRSGQAILYGGQWNMDFSAETWLWDGSDWTLLHPANSPGLVAGHAMAYDEARGKIVLFGGQSGVTYGWGNQTWVWEGNNWRQVRPAMSPPARFGHAMAYDSVSQKVILFGGYGDAGELNDTWIWDGANWTQSASPESPLARSGHSMAFDAARSEIVLFGGMQSHGTPAWFSDTWVWDGAVWHQKFVAAPPAGRSGHVLAYHPALRSVVMIGGAGGKEVTATSWNYDFRREIWMWDGEKWVQQFPMGQPGPAYSVGAALDDTEQALTIHLGDDLMCASRGPKTFLLKGPAASSSVTVASVTNAATGASGAIAPGELITIKGSGLGPAIGVSFSVDPNTGMVDTALAGTQVLFGGLPAPIVYASASQIDAIVPYELADQAQITMLASYQGAKSSAVALQLASAAPGVFTFSGAGSGQAAVINQDGSANGPSSPAQAGSSITLYFTGGGETNPPGVTGAISGAAVRRLTQSVSVTVGGQPATVIFAGAATGLMDGVCRLDIELAHDTPSGASEPLVITVGGISSPSTATVAVR